MVQLLACSHEQKMANKLLLMETNENTSSLCVQKSLTPKCLQIYSLIFFRRCITLVIC